MTEHRIVRFGVFQADLQSGELFRNGVKVRLADQPFQILAMLLDHPGELVTREQLCQRLWSTDTFVDFEHGLNAAVKKLREALGDEAENPRFVETLARGGYRFIAPVDSGGPPPVPPPRPRRTWVAVFAIFAAIVGAAVWVVVSRSKAPAPEWREVPLTSYPGNEVSPSFSPDGTQVAFAWNGEKQDNLDIYVKVIGKEEPWRLTTHPAPEACPAWSPDGRWIAFTRGLPGKHMTMLVPAIGGEERRLTEECAFGWVSGPYNGWSPDGKWLVVAGWPTCEEPPAIYLVSIKTGEKRKLTTPPATSIGDGALAFSPDGRTLAFVRSGSINSGDIHLLALSEGLAPTKEPRPLTFQNAQITSPVWTPDGREILYFADGWLWRVRVSNPARPERLEKLERVGPRSGIRVDVAASRKGNRLAFTQWHLDLNIWRLPLPVTPGATGNPGTLFLHSTQNEQSPQYSPDGKRIAFLSDRAGHEAIWVSDADGSNLVELATVGNRENGTPRWSPDGQRIAFDANPEGNWDIYVVSLRGGPPQRLTAHSADDAIPSWSRDGKWVYFFSQRSGKNQVWKVPPEGGEPVQVTRSGGYVAFESVDGRFLYYTKDEVSPLWRAPVEGDGEVQVLPSVVARAFFVMARGIYFIPEPARDGSLSLQFLDFASGRVKVIGPVPNRIDRGITVSPDERTVLYTVFERASADLVLVENFR